MIKWTIIGAVLLIGVVSGVVWFVDFAGGVGKDTVRLTDGTVLEVPLTHYEDGIFYYKTDKLGKEKIPLKDILRITFTTVQDDKLDKHELTTPAGKKLKCRMIRYYRGELTLKDPGGKERTGKISEIARIDFDR